MKGLITFIDILGYQSFLENNSATDSALRVLKLVTELPKNAEARNQQKWENFWKKKKGADNFPEIKIEHLIFSDTIVLLYKYPQQNQNLDTHAFAYFTFLTMDLFADLFTNGLPSRGVIHEGDFINQDTCFAGRGIVDAYRACSELDFSGLVLSEHLANLVTKNKELKADHIIVDYLAPLKDGEKRLKCLNWYSQLSDKDKQKCQSDVIQFVAESFWSHSKDLPKNTDSKIRNTCKQIRKFRMVLDSKK